MKYFISATAILLLLASGCKNKSAGNASTARITFLRDTFDFGKIKKGDSVLATFDYENTGDNLARIVNVSPGCGCSKANYDTSLLQAGAKATLELTYNSKDDSGNILKSLVVESNTSPRLKVLYLKGEVE